MQQPTHALQCEHGVHPRYCALCRARVLAEHGQADYRPNPHPRTYGPMPPWFRDEIERHKPRPATEQAELDLED